MSLGLGNGRIAKPKARLNARRRLAFSQLLADPESLTTINYRRVGQARRLNVIDQIGARRVTPPTIVAMPACVPSTV
jgi:hypothetical protein